MSRIRLNISVKGTGIEEGLLHRFNDRRRRSSGIVAVTTAERRVVRAVDHQDRPLEQRHLRNTAKRQKLADGRRLFGLLYEVADSHVEKWRKEE